MFGRLGWRGQCSCCDGPRGTGQLRAEEKREVARMADEAFDELAEQAPPQR